MIAGKVPEIIRNNRYKRMLTAKKKALKIMMGRTLMKEEKNKFPDRVILGEGYPWLYGTGKSDNPYYRIGLNKKPTAMNAIELNWDKALWRPTVPKYRLVLEKVDA